MPEKHLPRPTRRALARGVAWAAPTVVLVAGAPAVAASSPESGSTDTPTGGSGSGTTCQSYKLDWDNANFTVTTNRTSTAGATATAYGTSTGTPMTVSLYDSTGGTAVLDTSYNFKLGASSIGGLGTVPLALRTAAPVTGGIDNRSAVTFTFPTTVRSIAFTIADIDSSTSSSGSFKDRVAIAGLTPTIVSRGSSVTGAGTTASPLQGSTDNTDVISTSGAGNASIRIDASLTSFTLYLWSGVTGSGANTHLDVWISDMTFTTC